MARDQTVPPIEIPDFAHYDGRGSVAALVRTAVSAKGLLVAALAVLLWTGGKVTSTGQRLDQVERFMERAGPIIEAQGRGRCLENLADAQREGFPCAALLNGAGYLTRPAAADGVAVLGSRDVR